MTQISAITVKHDDSRTRSCELESLVSVTSSGKRVTPAHPYKLDAWKREWKSYLRVRQPVVNRDSRGLCLWKDLGLDQEIAPKLYAILGSELEVIVRVQTVLVWRRHVCIIKS